MLRLPNARDLPNGTDLITTVSVRIRPGDRFLIAYVPLGPGKSFLLPIRPLGDLRILSYHDEVAGAHVHDWPKSATQARVGVPCSAVDP